MLLKKSGDLGLGEPGLCAGTTEKACEWNSMWSLMTLFASAVAFAVAIAFTSSTQRALFGAACALGLGATVRSGLLLALVLRTMMPPQAPEAGAAGPIVVAGPMPDGYKIEPRNPDRPSGLPLSEETPP